MKLRILSALVVLMVLGCASTPKFKFVQKHDPIMDKNGGVVLLVDVCDQIDVVGNNDYFVVNESKEVANSLAKEIRAYLEHNGAHVLSEVIPFACGAFDTPGNQPMKVADKVGDVVRESPKPYGVSTEIENDAEYLNALDTLSTYVFERQMAEIIRGYSKRKDGVKAPALMVTDEQLKEASKVIKERTNSSSILYVGLRGTKISGGKKFGQFLASFTVGVATGLATGGMVAFIPGHKQDWKYSVAGLVNLDTGNLVWRSWSSGPGNPLKSKIVADPRAIERLLKDLVYDKEPLTASAAK